MAVRVRFAPSPTGHLHLGGLRTALYNALFARKHGGSFILRVEDTDQSRLVPGAAAEIEQLLTWAGIPPTESDARGGPAGPYTQSKRLEHYRRFTRQLLDSGVAYRCYCSPERLARVRALARATGQATPYDGACRYLSPAEQAEHERKKSPFVVRLRVPREKGASTLLRDRVFGDVAFDHAAVDDQVLVKSDGFPTYHLANVVDDHLMGITHVFRGEEWVSSTPKHLLLYQGLGLAPPEFVHLPLLFNMDRTKLSKRQSALNVDVLRRDGYLPSAVTNFCALLGWTAPDDQEVFTDLDALAAAFDVSRIHKAGALVNWDKLTWLHRQHMKGLAPDSADCARQAELLQDSAAARFPAAAPHRLAAPYLAGVVHTCRTTFDQSVEVLEKAPYFWERPDPADRTGFDPKVFSVGGLGSIPAVAAAIQAAADGDFVAPRLKPLISAAVKAQGCPLKEGFQCLRWALTGCTSGPALQEIMVLLGREESLARLTNGASAAGAGVSPGMA